MIELIELLRTRDPSKEVVIVLDWSAEPVEYVKPTLSERRTRDNPTGKLILNA